MLDSGFTKNNNSQNNKSPDKKYRRENKTPKAAVRVTRDPKSTVSLLDNPNTISINVVPALGVVPTPVITGAHPTSQTETKPHPSAYVNR
jgi:hypothetical protein